MPSRCKSTCELNNILEKKPAQEFPLAGFIIVVPTARLELAQLSPLPPQDSVSTNFTTTARLGHPGLREELARRNEKEFTLKIAASQDERRQLLMQITGTESVPRPKQRAPVPVLGPPRLAPDPLESARPRLAPV